MTVVNSLCEETKIQLVAWTSRRSSENRDQHKKQFGLETADLNISRATDSEFLLFGDPIHVARRIQNNSHFFRLLSFAQSTRSVVQRPAG